jgi:hypothetical protein
MNKLPHTYRVMRFKNFFPALGKDEGELIAGFGHAKLIRTFDCKYELFDGKVKAATNLSRRCNCLLEWWGGVYARVRSLYNR